MRLGTFQIHSHKTRIAQAWAHVCMDGKCLEHMSEFKDLGCILGESGTDEEECCRKVVSGWKCAGIISPWVMLGI